MPITAKLDEFGKPAWIALIVLGFMAWWPVGLGILAFTLFLPRPLSGPQILSSSLPDEATSCRTNRTKRNCANHSITERKALRRHRGPQFSGQSA